MQPKTGTDCLFLSFFHMMLRYNEVWRMFHLLKANRLMLKMTSFNPKSRGCLAAYPRTPSIEKRCICNHSIFLVIQFGIYLHSKKSLTIIWPKKSYFCSASPLFIDHPTFLSNLKQPVLLFLSLRLCFFSCSLQNDHPNNVLLTHPFTTFQSLLKGCPLWLSQPY